MNANELFFLRFDEIHVGTVDDIFAHSMQAQLRARPHGLNSAAWLLWHIARIEDLAVSRFIADRPQVLRRDGWNDRLGLARVDCGVGMTGDEVEQLSQQIDLEGLRGYFEAVAANTRDVVAGMSPVRLEQVVPPERVRSAVAEDAAVLPAGEWVVDFWAGGRPEGWILLQTALLHPYGHLFDCRTVLGLTSR